MCSLFAHAPRVAGPRAFHSSAARASGSSGLCGMPNVGKSTLFNALVRAQVAQAANFPFCTIDPQTALVAMPDARLQVLASLNQSVKVSGTQLSFTDIAGLIEGASKGAGLGNAFLGNIRAVNCILHVVRCFNDPDVIHVCNTPDPIRDIRIIEAELLLADLQSIEKRLGKDGRKAGNKALAAEAEVQARLLKEIAPLLEDGVPARVYEHRVPTKELPAWHRLQLLTQKPMVYVCNVGENHAATGNGMTKSVEAFVQETAKTYSQAMKGKLSDAAPGADAAALLTLEDSLRCSVAVVSAKLEAELSLLGDIERAEYLAEYGLKESGLQRLLTESARLLRVQTFYTAGPTESRAWTISQGSTAPEAAGAIHSDMQRGFIKAEVISYSDFVKHGGESGAKAAGKARSEGKEYIMQDGDVCLFRFNANQK